MAAMANAYEMLMIFPDALRDEALTRAVEAVRGEIAKVGGTVEGTDMIGRRPFAHPLQQRTSGQYVRLAFHCEPLRIEELSKRMKLNQDLFRFQIVRAEKRRATAHAAKEEPRGESQ